MITNLKFQSFCLVTVANFTGSNDKPANSDKHGKMPVILSILAGKAPNRTILSGTIAERNGFKVGCSYLVNCTEGESSVEYGRHFNWQIVKEATLMEVLQGASMIGKPEVFDVKEIISNELQEINAEIGNLSVSKPVL